jgi:hypothetical protein
MRSRGQDGADYLTGSTGGRRRTRWRDSRQRYLNQHPEVAAVIGLVGMGSLTAYEIIRTLDARDTVAHGWAHGATIGLVLGLAIVLVLVPAARWRNRRGRRPAFAWLITIAIVTWGATTIGTLPPRSQLTPYVITTSTEVAELTYTCVLCLLLDVLVVVAGAVMIKRRLAR